MNLKNLFFLVILVAMALGLFGVRQKIEDGKRRLAGAEKEVVEAIRKKEALEKEVAQKQSLEYLEREARDQLNLVKPGERIVILPPKEPAPGIRNQELGSEVTADHPTPNWQKWWKLFFE